MTTRTKLLLLILPVLLLISGCATMGNAASENPDDTEQKYSRARDVESREACLTGILIASGILGVVLFIALF